MRTDLLRRQRRRHARPRTTSATLNFALHNMAAPRAAAASDLPISAHLRPQGLVGLGKPALESAAHPARARAHTRTAADAVREKSNSWPGRSAGVTHGVHREPLGGQVRLDRPPPAARRPPPAKTQGRSEVSTCPYAANRGPQERHQRPTRLVQLDPALHGAETSSVSDTASTGWSGGIGRRDAAAADMAGVCSGLPLPRRPTCRGSRCSAGRRSHAGEASGSRSRCRPDPAGTNPCESAGNYPERVGS
jgi:hypothetical protein